MIVVEQKQDIVVLSRRQIAWRAAQDVVDGSYVNLGIGMPTLIADYVQPDKEVVYHSENGLLGMGPTPPPGEEDTNLVNAGKRFVSLQTGGSYFNTAESFAMMRGRHLTSVYMGAFQVSKNGDLANWTTSDNLLLPSVGGAMDLAVGSDDINILMNHVTRDGKPRILNECIYPLTAKAVVKRIYTDLAVIDVTKEGLYVRELVEGLDLDGLQRLTEAPLIMAEDWCTLKVPSL